MTERIKHDARGVMKLTQRRKLMIGFYMAGATQVDSMRMSGHTETASKANCSVEFKLPEVREEIERQQKALRKKYELDEDWVIQRLMRVADGGRILSKFKVVKKDGTLDWDFTGATSEELEVINELTVSYDKNGNKQMKIGHESVKGALDSLCRKLGMFQDIQINIGEVSLSDRISRGRERSRLAHKAGDDAKVINP